MKRFCLRYLSAIERDCTQTMFIYFFKSSNGRHIRINCIDLDTYANYAIKNASNRHSHSLHTENETMNLLN